MKNPEIGEKFLLLVSIAGVYGDEHTDITHRYATVVLDDGQRFETNLRNLLDPQIVVAHATAQTPHPDAAPVVEGPANVPPSGAPAAQTVAAPPPGAQSLV